MVELVDTPDLGSGALMSVKGQVLSAEVWDKQLKENYAKAAEALKGLGLTN